MSKLNILIVPDPLLRQTCAPVGLHDARLKKLADDMLETMYDAPGIGLAAPQIGVLERLLGMDVGEREDNTQNPLQLVNPEIIWRSEDLSTYREGCLSIPDQYADVERPAEVRVKYQTPGGEARELHATGLLATCVQHEIDHLNGVLFIDYLSKLKRDMILKRLRKAQRDEA